MTVTVCTGVPAPEVAAGNVAAAEEEEPAEDEAAPDEDVTALELDGPLTNLPPMMFAFWLAAPALLFR